MRPCGPGAVLAGAIVLWLAAWPAGATSRLERWYRADQGLLSADIRALAQDQDGLLWIGTTGGLYRYDGERFERWARGELAEIVSVLSPGLERPIALTASGRLWQITLDGAEPAPDRAASPLRDVTAAAYDGDGGLWVARRDGRLERFRNGAWTEVARLADGVRKMQRNAAGGLDLLLFGRGVWRIATPDAAAATLLDPDVAGPVAVVHTGAGTFWLLTFDGVVLEWVNGRFARRATLPGRGIDICERQGSLWVTTDRYLTRLDAAGRVLEQLGPEDGLPSGGPLLVDHESSLWVGTFAGLLQYPEPDTIVWTESDGLPSSHARFLVRDGDRLWVSTHQGLGLLAREHGSWRARTVVSNRGGGDLCLDEEGTLWAGLEGGIAEIRDTRVQRLHPVGFLVLFGCERDDAGNRWFASSNGLWLRTTEADDVVRIAPPAELGTLVRALAIENESRLWIGADETLCHADLDRPSELEWSCQRVPEAGEIKRLLRLPGGGLWASSNRLGVLSHEGDGWRALPWPDDPTLPTFALEEMAPGRDGTVWLLGFDSVIRVQPSAGGSDYSVLERISGWHGHPAGGAEDVLEDDDGRLWLSSFAGVVRIPPWVRALPSAAPRVILLRATSGDERLATDRPASLSARRNRITLRFATVSYRDRARLQFQERLKPTEPWQKVAGPPELRWVDLAPGSYHVEARATLDGRHWSEPPASFGFEILAPWYRQGWALALFAAIFAGTVGLLYRARVRMLLRLERQRTRIAMDLHDELGSALGSIALLAGLIGERHDPSEAATLANEIQRTASDLSARLGGIVWSLRPGKVALSEIADRLLEEAQRICAPAEIELEATTGEIDRNTRLDRARAHDVLLVGLEAMHNAVAHAGGSKIRITLEPLGAPSSWWRMVVADDGCGLSTDSQNRGFGLQSMQRRAFALGGRIEWVSADGGGTEVRLLFPLSPSFRMRWGRAAHDHRR